MLHCTYYNEESAYRASKRRYAKLLDAGYSVVLHPLDDDFDNFERLKINPFAHTDEDWEFIIYDDVSGKFFINGMDDLYAKDMPDYFRPRTERRLALEVALERAYSFGM
jgi:hypothetical protein